MKKILIATISGCLNLVPSLLAETVVESRAAVPNLFIYLPEELTRLRDPGLIGKSDVLFVWKAGIPVNLTAKVGGKEARIVCDGSYEKWPALMDEAIGKMIPSDLPSAPTDPLTSILKDKVDFWSLIQGLAAPVSPPQEKNILLSGSDALQLADRLLLLGIETSLNFDPECYHLLGRAVALATYAGKQENSLLPEADIRLAAALRLQGESALAIQLCAAQPSDPVSQGWVDYVLQRANDLTKLNETEKSEFFQKLHVLVLRLNGRNTDAAWREIYGQNPEDVWALSHLVGDGSISIARTYDKGYFHNFFRVETLRLIDWAKKVDSSFQSKLKENSWLFHPEEEVDFFKSELAEITEGQDALLAQLPPTPSTPWGVGTGELKQLLVGRREAVFWQKLRLFSDMWGVPEALPMAIAWNQDAPRSSLAQLALQNANERFGSPKMGATKIPDEMVRRTLLTHAAKEIFLKFEAERFPRKEWAEDQPAEIELLLAVTCLRAISQNWGEPPATLAKLLERDPMADPEIHKHQVDESMGSAERERFLGALLRAADRMSESSQMAGITAQAYFDYKKETDKALAFWERFRQMAPEKAEGYIEPARLLLLQEKPREALDSLKSSEGRVVEVEDKARVDGMRAKCLVELGQTNEAINLSEKASSVYSAAALENYADILAKAGRRGEVARIMGQYWDRYQSPLFDPEMFSTKETVGLRQKIYAQMRRGWNETGSMTRIFEILDEKGLFDEISSDIIPSPQVDWVCAPFISALLRKEQKWEEAKQVLAIGEKAYAGAPDEFDITRHRLKWEAERVEAKNSSLDGTKEEGFLAQGYSIGPFPNRFGEGYGTAYPPEKEFDLSKGYPGEGGIVCRWKLWKGGGVSPFWRPREFLFDKFPVWCVHYLRCVVDSDREKTCQLWYASRGGFTGVNLNGKWIVPNSASFQPQNKVLVQLQKGGNIFLFKVCAGNRTSDLAARLQ